eukprot:scaffold5562_cov156-Skeletonema_marinoi.AAC.7
MMRRRCVPSAVSMLLLLIVSCCVQHHHLLISAFTLPPPSLSRIHQPTTTCSGTVINFDRTTKRGTAKSSSLVIQLLSPSGIDEWPIISQTAVFFGAYAGLALACYPTIKLLESFSQSVVGLERWRIYMIDSTLPILMGLVYLLGGIGHFAAADSFQDIYPPMGTWGIWYLPGSAAFHVAWTGIIELFCGAGLIFSGIRDAIGSEDGEEENILINFIKPICASMLFLLTILVTPANIYMFTHGAVMGDMAPLDMSFHVIRFVVQVTFLSLLFTVARDSFFYAWGDELD